MVGGSFAVFSLLVSVLGLVSENTRISNDAIFLTIISGISIINISIIKYIISFKVEIVRANRHINCIRQALLALVYTKIHGKYPDKNINLGLKSKDTTYWEILGRHMKFPIDNRIYREKYRDPNIGWKNADFFSIYMIVFFTFILAMYPVSHFFINEYESISNHQNAVILGGIGGTFAVSLLLISRNLVNKEMKSVLDEMERDSGGSKSTVSD